MIPSLWNHDGARSTPSVPAARLGGTNRDPPRTGQRGRRVLQSPRVSRVQLGEGGPPDTPSTRTSVRAPREHSFPRRDRAGGGTITKVWTQCVPLFVRTTTSSRVCACVYTCTCAPVCTCVRTHIRVYPCLHVRLYSCACGLVISAGVGGVNRLRGKTN